MYFELGFSNATNGGGGGSPRHYPALRVPYAAVSISFAFLILPPCHTLAMPRSFPSLAWWVSCSVRGTRGRACTPTHAPVTCPPLPCTLSMCAHCPLIHAAPQVVEAFRARTGTHPALLLWSAASNECPGGGRYAAAAGAHWEYRCGLVHLYHTIWGGTAPPGLPALSKAIPVYVGRAHGGGGGAPRPPRPPPPPPAGRCGGCWCGVGLCVRGQLPCMYGCEVCGAQLCVFVSVFVCF
jgi:hypothetical protein